jgi:tetratricopeptide (TPR) repeat protein
MTRIITTAVISLALVGASTRGWAAEDPLDAAKSLYMSAAYEEALAALSNLPSSVDLDQADKFRALCFLALNRTQDAQQSLERLATRRPLLKFDDGESPKLVAMFRDARAKVLPAAARAMYGEAKTNFEQGELAKAQAQFADLLSMLSEKELVGQTAFADLRMLAEGFSKLTDQQIAAEKAADAAKAAAVAQAAQVPAAVDTNRIYTSADSDVLPPVAIEQTIPLWTPPSGNLRYQEFSGVLEIVVDETGVVTSATMAQHVNIIYDQVLLSATKRWRYRPAQRQGKPVKYRKALNIVLRPATPGPSGSGESFSDR